MSENKTKGKGFDFFNVVIKVGILISVLFVMVIYIYGQYVVENEDLYANQCDVFEGKWNYTDSSGVTKQYGSGETFGIEYGKDVVLSMQLPEEIGDGKVFFLRTDRDMEAYIDDELRNSYQISNSFFGPNVKPIWLSVTLRRTDASKTLYIVHKNYDNDTYTVSDIYIGNRLGFCVHLIHENIYTLIISFALIIFGLVITVICLANRISTKKDFPLWYLSLGVFCGALWLIFINYTYPMIFGNYFVDGIVGYMLVLLLPYDFVAYIKALLGRKYHIYYVVLSVLIIVDFWVLTLLDINNIAPFNKTMVVGIIVICISALFCLSAIIYDTFVKKNKENAIIAIGFVLSRVFI